MLFTIGTHEIQADVTDEEGYTSPHTGAELRQIEVLVRGRERDHHFIMDLLKEAQNQGLISTEPDGRSALWTMKQNSYSYSDNSSIRTYRWSLEEKEELRIETLVLGDLRLTPHQYEEEIDDGALIIKARFRLSPQELDAARTLMRGGEYFPVVRKGINSEPRQMRLGRGLWSQDADAIKQELILVDQAIDTRKQASGRGAVDRLHIGPANVEAVLSEKGAALEELIEILTEKGVLSDIDRERIKKATHERAWQLHSRFEQVKNLDEWSL